MKRVSKLIEEFQKDNIDAVLLTRPSSVQYFTGCKTVSRPPRILYTLVTSDESVYVFTPKLELNQTLDEMKVGEAVEIPRGTSAIKVMARFFNGIKTLGVEKDYIPLSIAEKIDYNVKLSDVTKLVNSLRAKKDDEEVYLIKRAVYITEKALKSASELITDGITERRIARELTLEILSGSEWVAFEPVVASGPRGAYPHGLSSDRRLNKGELVIIDIGARFEGYHADLSRTFPVDYVSNKLLELIYIVNEALESAIKGIRPGMKASDADNIARNIIEEYGYGENFNHSLGHGLGLDIHEYPRVSPQSSDVLEEGHVFTLEPGIYIKGLGGVRIEEDVILTRSGIKLLSTIPRISL